MRSLRCVPVFAALVTLAACARTPLMEVQSAPPAMPDARLLPKLVGTWQGRSYRTESDSGIAWTLIQQAEGGILVGRLAFTGSMIPPAEVKVIEVTDSTVTSFIGPYYSPTAGEDVVTRVEGRYDGDRLWGFFWARPVRGGDVVRGRFEATRVK